MGGLFAILCVLGVVEVELLHTSGKLDFDDSASPSKAEKIIPIKIFKNFESIPAASEHASSISCSTTGCNITKSNNSVETEVLVHVQTKINLDETQGKRVEDTPDVPIVVGHRGSNLDNTNFQNEGSNRRFDDFSRGYPSLRPTLMDQPLYPSDDLSRNFYRDSTPTYHTFIHRDHPLSKSTFNRHQNTYFRPATDRPWDYRSENAYNQQRNRNMLELGVPYLGHAYDRHHFGEEPPPQNILIGRDPAHNPVEFRTNSWRPSWNAPHKYNDNKYPYQGGPTVYATDDDINHGIGCSCRDQRTKGSNSLAFSASSNVHVVSTGAKGKVSIDGKLAPLN